MPEFLDFLKHKYAYVAIGEFKPGCFSEAQKLYEKAVSTYSTGFQGAFLLQKPGTDEGIAVIIWDKNFGKNKKEEPVEAPFSVPENAESVIVEIEDAPELVVEKVSAGKGFGW